MNVLDGLLLLCDCCCTATGCVQQALQLSVVVLQWRLQRQLGCHERDAHIIEAGVRHRRIICEGSIHGEELEAFHQRCQLGDLGRLSTTRASSNLAISASRARCAAIRHLLRHTQSSTASSGQLRSNCGLVARP